MKLLIIACQSWTNIHIFFNTFLDGGGGEGGVLAYSLPLRGPHIMFDTFIWMQKWAKLIEFNTSPWTNLRP